MTEWDVERLDLEHYLSRVAYDGELTPTLRMLARAAVLSSR
jgi:hypothetical protein